VVILFFACHAKKRTKTRLTGRAGKNHHGYQPSPGFVAQPHANYGQPGSGMLASLNPSGFALSVDISPRAKNARILIPLAQHHHYALDAKRKKKIPLRQRTV
jgi:hypothetical protein